MLCIHVANLLELLTLYLAKFDEVVNNKLVSLAVSFRTVDYLHWTDLYSSSYNCFSCSYTRIWISTFPFIPLWCFFHL